MSSDEKLRPEVYMRALKQFSPLQPRSEPRKHTRQAQILNALAALLVSKATGEMYAVALGLASPSEPPTLFIAGNKTFVPQETQYHCHAIATISAKFASSLYSPATVPVVEVGEIASDLIKDLHILVYRYSLSKIRRRANKITAEKISISSVIGRS